MHCALRALQLSQDVKGFQKIVYFFFGSNSITSKVAG